MFGLNPGGHPDPCLILHVGLDDPLEGYLLKRLLVLKELLDVVPQVILEEPTPHRSGNVADQLLVKWF